MAVVVVVDNLLPSVIIIKGIDGVSNSVAISVPPLIKGEIGVWIVGFPLSYF